MEKQTLHYQKDIQHVFMLSYIHTYHAYIAASYMMRICSKTFILSMLFFILIFLFVKYDFVVSVKFATRHVLFSKLKT